MKVLFFTLFLISHQALGVSGIDFIAGSDESFNKVFVKRFVVSAVKSFSTTGKMSADFKKEFSEFVDTESSFLYSDGDGEKVKRTKFYLTFFIKNRSVQKTHITFFSNNKTLSSWDLTNFQKVSNNYPAKHSDLPTSCSSIKLKKEKIDFFKFSLEDDSCLAFYTVATLKHPAYKGYVETFGKKEQFMPIVKNLLPGMAEIPASVIIFSHEWRLPVSRYYNADEVSKVYLP